MSAIVRHARARHAVPTARRGAALVLVLWLMVVLGTLAAAVVAATRDATGTASNLRARAVARYAAESGVVATVREVDDALLAIGADATRRAAYLNALEAVTARSVTDSLGEARFQSAIVDASARLDVNVADVESLAALFAGIGAPAEARAAAEAVRRWTGARGLEGGDLGAGVGRRRHPLRSLDDLVRIPGLRATLARAAAPYLTVDGDGQVNRAAAAPAVRAAARGTMVDEPTRLVIVSRGWLAGHPLTHEIQAVYAVRGSRLAFVRWRERDL